MNTTDIVFGDNMLRSEMPSKLVSSGSGTCEVPFSGARPVETLGDCKLENMAGDCAVLRLLWRNCSKSMTSAGLELSVDRGTCHILGVSMILPGV